MFVTGLIAGPSLLTLISRAAVTIFWDGGGDGVSWSDPLNWNTDVVPVPTDEVLIDTANRVTINAPITVKSLTLGKLVGGTATILEFSYDAISIGPMTIDDGDLTLYSGASITHTAASGSTVLARVNFNVTTGNAYIYGTINIDAKGYPSGNGPGVGQGGYGGTGGGGYGGYGGNGQSGLLGGSSYGDPVAPVYLGSAAGTYYTGGSGGGALKMIVAGTTLINGTITANGGGGACGGGDCAGGGSGGSIWISTGTLNGTGTIRANGGGTGDWDRDGGGGSGGRIALYYTTDSSTFTLLTAKGARPYGGKYGGAGTIYKKAASAANGDYIISNEETSWNTDINTVAITPLNAGLTVDNITVSKWARIELTDTLTVVNNLTINSNAYFKVFGTVATNQLNIATNGWYFNEVGSSTTYSSINWGGGIITDNGGTMAVVSSGASLTVPTSSTLYANTARTFPDITINGTLSHYSNSNVESYKINYTATNNFTLNSGAFINVDSRGYTSGNGPGVGQGGYGGTGGGAYGGNGGNGQSGLLGGTAYGDPVYPFNIGSAAGTYYTGGPGGGAVKLTVTGITTINGTITANGGGGSCGGGDCAGGGAGGSVWITTGTLTGTGTIRANGGGTGDWDRDGGGGSGGRIALHYTTDTSVLTSLTANGARPYGGRYGGAGTIFKKAASAANGDYIISNGETSWNTDLNTVAITPLNNGLTVDNMTVSKWARIELTDSLTVVNNLTVNSNAYFKVLGTLATNQLNIATNGWYFNETGSTTTYSTINWGGGIITDNGGTMAVVSSGASLTVPASSTLYANTARTFPDVTISGTLSHYSNSNVETYKINYTATNNFTLNSGAFINVDARGYTSSYGPGLGQGGYGGTGGGGYGGRGGNGQNGLLGGVSYGDPVYPFNIGSPGGHYYTGGQGGGAVKITVAGITTINGTITANGTSGSCGGGDCSGGGSGGSVWITTGTFTGTGTIRANGGGAGNWDRDGGGGGGGRIAIHYTTDTSVLTSLVAKGARPDGSAMYGGAGTIYKKAASQANGDYIINNEESSWSTDINTVAITPLNNGLIVDNITISKWARVDLTDTLTVINNLNLSNNAHLKVVNRLIVNNLNLSTSGWLYNELTANTTYTNLSWTGALITDNGGTFALLSSGGPLLVPATSTLYANKPRTFSDINISGTLSHYSNTNEATYKINLISTGDFLLAGTGIINVDARGYSSGNGPGAGAGGWGGTGGGGYGGKGGNGQNGLLGGPAYGDEYAPDWLGSAGGHYYTGGSGGGAVKIAASGTSTINGTITANGGGPSCGGGDCSGGGAGGSVWIVTDTLAGNGIVRANGAAGGNWDRDGGGGAGGRIAFYYTINNAAFTSTTVSGAAGGPSAYPGANGTIFFGGKSADPINLKQYKLDGVTGIAQGGGTNENSVILTFQVQDGNTSDTLTPEVEFLPLGSDFNDIATNTGDPVVYNGSAVTAQVNVSGLADNEAYHWQARACDATNLCSNWISFGNNLESEADIRVVMNTSPNVPVIPESSFYINSQFTNNLNPTLGFVLTDPNSIDAIKYRIQISEDPGFSPPLIDYTSELAAQGTSFFSVGQAAGDGTYSVGSEGQQLATGSYYWRVKAIDDKSGESDWTVAPGTPAFRIDLARPTNASNVRMKAYKNAINEYVESEDVIWFNRNDLYFQWDPGTDTEGVKGYCLYLGADSMGDPGQQKGLLGSSPISTTGSNCQFITDNTEIDFSNSAFRGTEWLSSSLDKYYFKVKTIDIANNTYEGPDVSNFISFNFDNTPPQNVTAISAASGTFSNTADMFFTWSMGEGHGGSDDHSGLLGFQYALNSRSQWYGDNIDPFTSLPFSLLSRTQPVYLPAEVQSLVQLGQNTIYFRVLDTAGNVSELRTAFIAYGGEAPKFSQGEEVYVIPTQNTINRFAFEWLPAIPSEGNSIESYYYMINTIPPASYSTITSNSATYRPTTETSVPEANISGLRRGANTIHVVAVDTIGNYSPTNYITATFYLNSDLPDPPKSLTVADSSIKDASIWRAALVWDVPDYRGTGDLTYHIERSDDGLTWQEISTTTGTSYVDTVSESKRYYWRVATTDTSDQSLAAPSYSNAVSVIPKGSYTVPARLTSGPASSSITTTTATITWTTARTCDSKIAIGQAPGNYFISETYVSTHVTDHIVPLANLTPGTTYYYVAKWTDEDGNTGISEEKTFTTEPPPVVKEVRLSNLGISSVLINFTTLNAHRARIYYGTTASFGGIKEIGTSKLETAYTVELDQLMDGTKYYYKINTFDEEGKEYEGTILDFTTLPRPRVSEVMIQQVVNTAQSTLLVSWQSNTSISSVVTYFPETNPELARDIVDLKLVEGEHKMLIKGLFPQMTYIIRVSGKDIIGNEALSDAIRITTAADSRAPLLSSMTIESTNVTQVSGMTQTTNSQLIVSWTTDEPSTSQVEFGEGSGTVYNQLTQQDTDLSYNHVVIISGLTPSKVYHLRAISMDAAGNVSKSIDTLTITPKATDNAFDLVITILKDSFGFLTE